MLTTEIILCLATLGNIGWAYWNYRTHRNRTLLYQVMERSSLSREGPCRRSASSRDECGEQQSPRAEYKVCSVCQRIVALHETDESGKRSARTACYNARRI